MLLEILLFLLFATSNGFKTAPDLLESTDFWSLNSQLVLKHFISSYNCAPWSIYMYSQLIYYMTITTCICTTKRCYIVLF